MKNDMQFVNARSKAIVSICCLFGLSASAQVTVYSDPSSWAAAIGPASLNTVSFEGFLGSPLDPNANNPGFDPVANNFTYFSSPPGLTVGGVNFQYTDP